MFTSLFSAPAPDNLDCLGFLIDGAPFIFRLHLPGNLSILTRSQVFRMFARTVIFTLSLAVFGTYGCARVIVSSSQNQKPEFEPPPAKRSGEAGFASELSSLPNPSEQARIEEQQNIHEEDVSLPIKIPPVDSAKTAVAKSAPKAELRVKPRRRENENPTTFQKTEGPLADDRLLDLLEKDLDKAVEQPIERRRIHFSKAVTDHPRVRYFIKYFSNTQSNYFATVLARSGRYFSMIATILREEGLPEEFAYLALIESNFDPRASSPSDAVGLWQFVPVTARKYGLRINSWVDERRDPVKSTRAAAAYLKELHAYFGRWYLTTAAYNAGQGTIDKALQRSGTKDFWSLSEKAKLSDETRNFVPKFVAASLIASNPRKYGFTAVPYEAPLMYEEVEVRGNLPLALLAEKAGTDFGTIQNLNPELRQDYTPPGESSFRLKIPAGHAEIFAQAYQEEQSPEPVEVVTHEVRKGETLYAIARRYGQEVRSLMQLNRLTSSHLQVGQRLMVILKGLGGSLR